MLGHKFDFRNRQGGNWEGYPGAVEVLSPVVRLEVEDIDSPGYLCHIGAEPITNCNSNETYVILFQIYPCITYEKSRRISGVEHGFLGHYIIPHESILKINVFQHFWVTDHLLYTKQ